MAQQGSKDAPLEELEDFLRENAERRLCMAAVDVEHFKLDEAGCNWEQYSPSMREKLKQRQQLLIEIERALQNKEFCFYLQPKCNSMTHAIVGMEALVRWNHPTRGIVSPGEFVPLMEETGLITRLDLYLWEEVCQMLHGWKARNENMVPISVNVSISDIAALDVAQVLWELVQKYQLEPKLLLAEITESMLAQNLKMVENTIAALHRKGFAVLMDDFGSGYSSLNMLRNTSVDAIKLDMQFIVRDSESSKGRQIVESVIEMARRLNLPIIAEGVETQEQVFMLQSMDCLYTQGYYFYKPMAVKQAEELLAQPAMENYWDLRRDMTRRNYKAFTGGLVSEKSAITLQAFQILADNALVLARLDLAEDALDDKPACPLCGDTGWRGTEMCRCLRALCAQEQIRELSKLLDLGEQSFDTFRMDYYSTSFWPEWGTSPRENMELVYEVCLNYAQKFGRFYFKNLFLSGAPGLGKTFLSACIARTVSENGHSVVYDTAGNVFAQFEARKFLRDSDDGREARDETRRYLGCDLLILDDLGSELTTQFTQSALYELINGRLVGGKRTVISSNLSMEEAAVRYSPQIASRLEGEYHLLHFFGEDIRLLRKKQL